MNHTYHEARTGTTTDHEVAIGTHLAAAENCQRPEEWLAPTSAPAVTASAATSPPSKAIEACDDRILDFGHFIIPLLPSPGTSTDWTANDVCWHAERFYRPLQMMSRTEIAVVPPEPDFFGNTPGWNHVREALWQEMLDATRIRWVLLTQHPENIAKSLPEDWGRKGYANICLGLVVKDADDFSRQLQVLKDTPARYRMILLTPSSQPINLAGCLDEIHWVVFAGDSGDVQAAAIEAVCRDAKVAFLFHRMDKASCTLADDEFLPQPNDCEQQWPKHPFGPEVQLDRPAHPSLKPVIDALHAVFVPRSATCPDPEIPTRPIMSKINVQSLITTKNMSEANQHIISVESTAPGIKNIPAEDQQHSGQKELGIPPLPEGVTIMPAYSAAVNSEKSAALVVTPEQTASPESSSTESIKSPATPQPKDSGKHLHRRKAEEVIEVHAEVMPPAHPVELSAEDIAYRQKREAIVTTAVKASIAAAKALYEIFSYCGGVLWKADFSSFEEYCRAKWGYQKSQGYRLLETGGFIIDLENSHSPIGECMPQNEGQLRPLFANVPKELRLECWKEMVQCNPPVELNYKIVDAEVRKFLSAKGIKTKPSKPAKSTEKPATSLEESIIMKEVWRIYNEEILQNLDSAGLQPLQIVFTISPSGSGSRSAIHKITIASAIKRPDVVVSKESRAPAPKKYYIPAKRIRPCQTSGCLPTAKRQRNM